MSSEYFVRLKATIPEVVAKLRGKGIKPTHLAFGGEGVIPAQKPKIPTDARSEFLANRAMGDWAENVFSRALTAALPEWAVVRYGNTDRIAAGHPAFKARYLAGLDGTRLFGKRPDLLVFPATFVVDGDLSERSYLETEPTVRQAQMRRNGLPLSKLSGSRLTKTGCTTPPRRLQNIGDKNASDTNARHLRNLSFD